MTVDARNKLKAVIDQRPVIHRPETEVDRAVKSTESALDMAFEHNTDPAECYGVDPGVAWFVFDHMHAGARTLETGAGLSTFAFALSGVTHTSVTPNSEEVATMNRYADEHDIDLSRVTFIPRTSEEYLPACDLAGLDAVLLDGKHAFPWPIVDFFYTADRLRRGGLILVDDVQLRSVGVLIDFLDSEGERWERAATVGRTAIYRKLVDRALDVAWHMQPWTVQTSRNGLGSRLKRALRRV